MHSMIVSTATRYLLPLLLMFSIFLLLRGHNEPGGGFIGGLAASAGFALYALALGLRPTKQMMGVEPLTLMFVGLALAVASSLISVLGGLTFMTGLWSNQALPIIGKLGTPLLFDIGVFFVVIGVSLTIIFALIENEEAQVQQPVSEE